MLMLYLQLLHTTCAPLPLTISKVDYYIFIKFGILAIGIDKGEHKRLLERLSKLIEDDAIPSHWQDMEKQLVEAYDDLNKLLQEIEQSAIAYKGLNEMIRPQAAMALRRLKKDSKEK